MTEEQHRLIKCCVRLEQLDIVSVNDFIRHQNSRELLESAGRLGGCEPTPPKYSQYVDPVTKPRVGMVGIIRRHIKAVKQETENPQTLGQKASGKHKGTSGVKRRNRIQKQHNREGGISCGGDMDLRVETNNHPQIHGDTTSSAEISMSINGVCRQVVALGCVGSDDAIPGKLDADKEGMGDGAVVDEGGGQVEGKGGAICLEKRGNEEEGRGGRRVYVCGQCGREYRSSSTLAVHRRTHSELRPHVCPHCGRSFREKHQMTLHLNAHSAKQFMCTLCGHKFTREYSVYEHVTRVHAGQRKFSCPHCARTFSHSGHMKRHVSIVHDKDGRHTCAVCGVRYPQRSSLDSHMRSHTNERPFKCELCKKGFIRSSHLASHMSVHTQERPYQCTHCGSAFSRKHHLEEHARTHTGERPYACADCGRTYSRSAHLQKHRLTHQVTPLDEARCGQCGKSFRSYAHMRDHERTVHATERPHVCTVCGRQFALRVKLTRHLVTHTMERPYSCPHCSRTYAHCSHVRRHIKAAHPSLLKPPRSSHTFGGNR